MTQRSIIVCSAVFASMLTYSTPGIAEEITGAAPMQPGSMPMMNQAGGMPDYRGQQNNMAMPQGPQGGIPMGQMHYPGMHMMGPQSGMPMHQGQQGQMPMMMGRRGGMMNPELMAQRQQMMQQHRQSVEQRLSNIEALLQQLLELQQSK